METVRHTFEPVYNVDSRILIVGTMPSVLSREQNFYYGNPRNRFYEVLAALLRVRRPETIDEKRDMLLKYGIAVYDVLSACEIHGSADASIKNARPNDFSGIFDTANIRCVYANGATANRYYQKFIGEDVIQLPSTSPANAAWGIERLRKAWSVILEWL